jgi:hypothetical protein
VVGGLLGAALGGRNAAATAAIGAGAGALLGGAAGYGVARQNLQRAQTEDNLKKAIAEANQDAMAFQRSANASAQIAQDARARATMLQAQYQQKTITAEQYRRSLASYQQSADIMQKQLGQMNQETASLKTDATTLAANDSQTMIAIARQIDEARLREQRSYEDLQAIVASAPAG